MSRAMFDECSDEWHRVAYRVGYRLLGRHDAAQDVAQEALARALLHRRALQRHPQPAAWIARVAANIVVGTWRSQRSAHSEVDRSAGDTIELAGVRLDLQRSLRSLPRRQREAVVLRYLADFSERATAEALGCSEGTVKQHASRGLAALRAQLGEPVQEVVADVRAPG